MATYWENSCSFGLRYVSWYKYLIVSLVFSTSVFGVGIFFWLRLFLIFVYLYLFFIREYYITHGFQNIQRSGFHVSSGLIAEQMTRIVSYMMIGRITRTASTIIKYVLLNWQWLLISEIGSCIIYVYIVYQNQSWHENLSLYISKATCDVKKTRILKGWCVVFCNECCLTWLFELNDVTYMYM